MKTGKILVMVFALFSIIPFISTEPIFAGTPSITVSTDKTSYRTGDLIIISGQVNDLKANTPVTIQVFEPTLGRQVGFLQSVVGEDKKFSAELTAGGIYWSSFGVYTIHVVYESEDNWGETTFQFTEQDSPSQTTQSDNDTPRTVPKADSTPPTLTTPDEIVVNSTRSSGATVAFLVKAVDDIDGELPPFCSPSSGSLFPIGESTVTCKASDSSGNSAEDSFRIIVNSGEFLIPEWIRNNALWWSDDLISESEFVNGIQFLIDDKIIQISAQSLTDESQSSVPSWIKETAGWWATDQVSDTEFINGLTWLIENGVLRI